MVNGRCIRHVVQVLCHILHYFHFTAVGCSTPGEVHLMGDEVIYSRDGDTLNVTCRSTGHLVWSLHCVDNTWVGEKSNCTTGDSYYTPGQLTILKFVTR